jgi:hypothetical protein
MKHKIKLKKFDLDGGGKHIAVRCEINGVKALLIIDTGASNSIFDLNSELFDKDNISDVSDMGTGSGFNSVIPELGKGVIKKISMGRMKINDFNAVFTPMSHINDLYKVLKLPHISGLLGSDFLFKYKALIDFENQIMWLEKN